MTEANQEGQPEEAGSPENDAASPARSHHRRTFSFVAIFVLVTLTLLTAYRYAIDTRLNDWYLFNVAKHTAWALQFAGESSKLEDPRRMRLDPAEARASIQAWQSGLDAATPEQIAQASGEPLSPWEIWTFNALRKRHTNHPGEVGPHITFVWREGPTTKILQLEYEREKLTKEDDPANSEKMEAINAELAELQQERMEIIRSPEENTHRQDRFFTFIIIPECGAIEIMAIFIAAVLAFPTNRRKKLIGVLAGIPLMYAVNIFRLSCLGVIGALDSTPTRQWFNFTHEYVWQVVYIIFVVIVWLLWVEFVVRRRDA